MKKRVLAGLLWFITAWCLWSAVANLTGLVVAAGPLLGLGVGLFVAGDPLGRIWGGKAVGLAVVAPPSKRSELA